MKFKTYFLYKKKKSKMSSAAAVAGTLRVNFLQNDLQERMFMNKRLFTSGSSL